MKRAETKQLSIAYIDTGPSQGLPVILLHGFPYDVHSYDEVSRQLSDKGFRCIVPYLRGYGPTLFKTSETIRSGQQAALGSDLLELMNVLKIAKAYLGGYDWGGRAACIVSALWPERVKGLVSCGTGYNIQNIAQAKFPVHASEEYRYWYQYYFHTERGELGLKQNRHELCQFIWQLWSPSWKFDQATYDRSAESFKNPDFVDIVIHSYRHRFGIIPGDPIYDHLEIQLAAQPEIKVPSTVLLGNDDGVDPPSPIDHDTAYFKGPYERRVINGAGHNLPQEAPDAFVDALLALARKD